MRALALLCMTAVALWSEDGCPTCNGAKQIRCYQYAGRPAAQGPCAACFGSGGATCGLCAGAGTRACPSCKATGLVEAFKCAFCNGAGNLACKGCDKGKTKCSVCGGSGGVPTNCDACAKSGKLPCPECAAMAVPCSGCKGSSFENCGVCGGKGEALALCGTCAGAGKMPCKACDGFGTIPCGNCNALGAKLSMMADGTRVLQGNPCRACQKTGELKCANCKAKGTVACKDCAGKGTKASECWLCDGQKTMPCRRCSSGRAWTGEGATSGIRCVVFDCSVFQPRLAQGLKSVLHLGDYAVWRVVIDARGAHGRVTLGGDGWDLVLVSSSGAETPMKDAYEGLSPDQVKLLERWVESQGDVPEALKRPFGVGGGDVRTCLALTSGSTLKDAARFRLGLPTDASASPIDLAPDDALWQTWVRERLLAAAE